MIDGSAGWSGGRTHLVSLGDLVDRGPESRRVLDLLIRLQPYYEMDRVEAPSQLLQIFDEMKEEMVGYLEVKTLPSDATVTLNGEIEAGLSAKGETASNEIFGPKYLLLGTPVA